MADLYKIVLTSALTILGGCLLLVIQRFVLDPLNEQSRVIGRISFAMHYYGREYNSPLKLQSPSQSDYERYLKVSDELRRLASSLAEASQSVRCYWALRLLGLTPSRNKINRAIRLLTGMSNNLFVHDPDWAVSQVNENWRDADEDIRVLGLRRWGEIKEQTLRQA